MEHIPIITILATEIGAPIFIGVETANRTGRIGLGILAGAGTVVVEGVVNYLAIRKFLPDRMSLWQWLHPTK